MKSAEILSKTDRTCWSRILMVARFYLAPARWQLWAFPLLSLSVFALINSFDYTDHPRAYSLAVSPLTLAMTFAPMVLGYRKGREVGAMLPALDFEKCVAILGYFLVVVPLLLFGPIEILSLIVHGSSYQLGLISSACIISTSLWGVLRARRSPMLWSFLAVVILYFAVVFIAMFVGFGLGVYAAFSHPEIAETETEALKNAVVSQTITSFSTVMLILSAIYFIFAVAMCCRAIHRSQL